MLDFTTDLTVLQEAREAAMARDGNQRALTKDKKAAAAGEQTRAEQLTIAQLVPQAREFLETILAHYVKGNAKRPLWHAIIAGLDLDEVAAAAVRSGFAGALKALPLARALTIAGQHAEIIWAMSAIRAKAQDAAARKRVRGIPAKHQTAQGRLRAARRALAVAMEDEQPEIANGETGWDDETLCNVGVPLLCTAINTGLFVVVEGRDRKTGETKLTFELSDAGRALVSEVNDLGLLTRPIYRPMLAPPRPWEALKGGAYYTEPVRDHLRLVRSCSPAQKGLLAKGIRDGSLRPVQDALNAIQSVPMRIDGAVLGLRRWCMDNEIDMPGVLPLREKVAVPAEKPAGSEDWPEARWRKHWAQRSRASRVNKGISPNLLAFHAVTREVLELWQADLPIYEPHSLDFRGRVYPVCFVSHQGGDASRALFRFWESKPLGPYGLWWLKVHAANCGDFGKVSKKAFWARVAWCDENMDLIRATAEDPHGDRRWMEADAPFSFYAACRELVAAVDAENPEEFLSSLPVALDGSNSGVQHYSALMRAEEGRYVNLTPSEEPQDLYRIIAEAAATKAGRVAARVRLRAAKLGLEYPGRDEVVRQLDHLNGALEERKTQERRQSEADTPHAGRLPRKKATVFSPTTAKLKARRSLLCALLWDYEGITRSTVKRNVMTFGYSSTAYGMAEQCREDYMEPLALRVMRGELPAHPFGDDEGKAAATWLGKAVYRSVCQVLPNVAKAMAWLREAAGILAHEGRGVLLVTPMGFPMLMRDTESTTKHIELLLLNKAIKAAEKPAKAVVLSDGASVLERIQLHITERPTGFEDVIKHAQQNGVAPNVIHAMDACHLHMVVLRLQELGVTDVMLIHDSFATHAGNVGLMSITLREQLVNLYENYCPLSDIYQRARRILSEEGRSRLQEPPQKGSLNLWDSVMESAYAFA